MRTLPLLVAVLLLAPGPADAGSRHERTRESVKRKSGKGSRSSDSSSGDDGGDAFGSCLGSCLASGCDLAGQVAVDAVAEAAKNPPRFERAPGIEEPAAEPLPEGEPPPEEATEPREEVAPEERRADLPPWLVPAAPGFEEGHAEAGPGWMPAPGGDDPEPPDGRRAVAPASSEELAAGGDEAQASVAVEDDGPADVDVADFAEVPPEAPLPAPARPTPSGVNADLRATAAWIPAELPNASLDLRASVGAVAGPGIEAWYTGLWEKIDGTWDHLPVGGLRVAFAFGSERVRPAFRLGGVLLDGELLGFDLGARLEVRLGGAEQAPRLDLSADAFLFDGFVSTDLGAGVSIPQGPFFVRLGVRSLYVEGFYAGPEAGVGLRF